VAFASSLDQISPFARNVSDCAAFLQAIQGFDPHDSTSIHPLEGVDYTAHLDQGVGKLRIGLISELTAGMQPEVMEALEKAVDTYKSLGATVSRVSIPSIRYAIASYYILATAEASSNLARFDGVRYGLSHPEAQDMITQYRTTRAEGFGAEVKRRIMLGTFSLSSGYYDAYYGKAQKVQALLAQEFENAYQQVDVLLCPTSPTTAFKIGEKASDPVSMYLSDIATIPVNLVGIPAISIPGGLDQAQLPIGLQLLAPHYGEATLFRAAYAYEQATGFHDWVPPLKACSTR
jgi:aspartyl-tRNA(Asn)/glutamyl-tRNA(Gln) amidotransferase subunit A